MGSVFTVERIRRSLLLMIGFPSWIIYLYVFGFGFLVLCILKVSRATGSLHRAVDPMHASMSGCRLRTLPLRGVRIHGPVDHGVLPGGWYSSLYLYLCM